MALIFSWLCSYWNLIWKVKQVERIYLIHHIRNLHSLISVQLWSPEPKILAVSPHQNNSWLSLILGGQRAGPAKTTWCWSSQKPWTLNTDLRRSPSEQLPCINTLQQETVLPCSHHWWTSIGANYCCFLIIFKVAVKLSFYEFIKRCVIRRKFDLLNLFQVVCHLLFILKKLRWYPILRIVKAIIYFWRVKRAHPICNQ